MTDEIPAGLHVVTDDEVSLTTAEANADEAEADIQVWIPEAFYTAKGVLNGFDVVLLHVVVLDPNTMERGAFVLPLGRELALDLRDQLNSVAATVRPLKKQIQAATAAIENTEAPRG